MSMFTLLPRTAPDQPLRSLQSGAPCGPSPIAVHSGRADVPIRRASTPTSRAPYDSGGVAALGRRGMAMSERAAKTIFHEALDVPAAERAAWLRERCGSDPSVHGRVEALLAAHERAAGLFGETGASVSPLFSPLEVPKGFVEASLEYESGDRIGPYEILKRAGRGGFGTVYLAEQREPVVRRVALKVLRVSVGSEAALARFDAERQALARMEHPAIASVYDAGTTEAGQPYFVMEYVDGAPITEYCHTAGMQLDDVLQLFATMCQAVHHAHQKGVVHRDLKPSNVLVAEVDGAPFPKVIDFGVAKAIDRPLTELSVVSVAGQMIGTPAYMSPEQARGEIDVDTRTDVYALGAMLYELVCGRAPFEPDTLGFVGLMRAIAETDPPLPSRRLADDPDASTIRFVPPDLDWIAMRCLEKDRARRYESAFALKRDVDRFLQGLPVEAAPPSAWYRLRKLAARHRVAFVAACAFLLALVGGVIGTGIGLVRARRANVQLVYANAATRAEMERAQRAERRAEQEATRAFEQSEVARAVNDFLTKDVLASASPWMDPERGRTILLRDVLDASAENLAADTAAGGRFHGKPVVESAIRHTLGVVYGELGELRLAELHSRRAAELRASALGPQDPLTLQSLSALSGHLRELQRHEEAWTILEPTLEAQRELLGDDNLHTLATAMRAGKLLSAQGRADEAYELLQTSYARARDSHGARAQISMDLLGALAIAATRAGRHDQAEQLFRRAIELRREIQGDAHPATGHAVINLASFLRAVHHYDEARSLLEGAIATYADTLGDDHYMMGKALYNLGALEFDCGRRAEAEAVFRRVLEICQPALGLRHQVVLQTRAALARTLEGRADRSEIEELYREVLRDSIESLGADHPVTNSRRQDLSGFLFHDPAAREEVTELLESSLEINQRKRGADHPKTLTAMENLALFHKVQGRLEEAKELLLEVVEGSRSRLGADHINTLKAESSLAGLYLDEEQYEQAAQLARSTVEIGSSALTPDDYDLARFRLRLALALDGLNRREEAFEVAEKAHAGLVRARGPQDPMTEFARQRLEEWRPAE